MTRGRLVHRGGEWIPVSQSERPTAAGSIPARQISTDTTRTVSTVLTTEADELRYQIRELSDNIDGVHQQTYMREWQIRTQERTALSAIELLEKVADLGFAWRDIARLVGVTVPAIQKWRKGGSVASENRQRLAALLGACDLIERHRSIADIGQWFEIPVLQGIPVTPIDLWTDGQYALVFEFALQHSTAEDVLDRYQADWRECYDSDYEVFTAGDGELSIRLRER